ncbi:MAG: hypothetical protein ABSH41_24545 [Syntrophobacteraceae bacterium]
MKRISFILMTAILLAGGAVAVMSAPSYAQVYEYPPPPSDPSASPWVGPDTPWVYYNGDWFMNGILYYFYGPDYGWAPYYAYAPSYIVRLGTWYAPRWMAWYQEQPQYLESFQRQYPYWSGHRQGQRYSQKFYEQHHGGQGGGWQKGFQGHPAAPSRPEARKPGPAKVPSPEKQQPAVKHEQRPQLQQQQPAVKREQRPQPQQQHPGVQREPQAQKEHQQQQPQHQGDAKEKEKQKGHEQ